MTKKNLSTYEEFIQDSQQKKLLEEEYQELLLSELFLALMEEDQISVRRLAEAAGVSPTIIQELRTGKKDNLTLKTFLLLIESLGYTLVLEKGLVVQKVTKPTRPLVKRRKIRFSLGSKRSLVRRGARKVAHPRNK